MVVPAPYVNPNPRTVPEWMERVNPMTGFAYTQDEALHKINEEVFGVGYQVGPDGKPIEVGKGSALQPTQQHFDALAKEKERQKLYGRMLDPQPAMTPETFAAGVKAAMASKPTGKKRGPKPKVKEPAEHADA